MPTSCGILEANWPNFPGTGTLSTDAGATLSSLRYDPVTGFVWGAPIHGYLWADIPDTGKSVVNADPTTTGTLMHAANAWIPLQLTNTTTRTALVAIFLQFQFRANCITATTAAQATTYLGFLQATGYSPVTDPVPGTYYPQYEPLGGIDLNSFGGVSYTGGQRVSVNFAYVSPGQTLYSKTGVIYNRDVTGGWNTSGNQCVVSNIRVSMLGTPAGFN